MDNTWAKRTTPRGSAGPHPSARLVTPSAPASGSGTDREGLALVARLIRGLGALALLLTLLVGVPAVLLAFEGNPLAGSWSLADLLDVLRRPDDGTVLLRLLTLVAWLAWAVLALSVVVELVGVATRYRVRITLPGLAAPQRLAAGLIVAVLALAVAPVVPHAGPALATAHAHTPRTPAGPRPAEVTRPGADPAEVPTAVAPLPAGAVVHQVQPGDDLWSLAQLHYGSGTEWRRIASANPGLLTGGPDRLEVGWRLVLPEVEARRPAEPLEDQRSVTVRRGDTLSAIAERELGGPDRWTELYRANRAVLADPDEIEPGLRLLLPVARQAPSAAPEAKAEPVLQPSEPSVPSGDAGARGSGGPPSASSARPLPPREDGVPRSPAPPEPAPERPVEERPADEHAADVVLPLAAVGGLLAAGLLAGLAARRRRQLAVRPVGRRIAHPAPTTVPVEAALGRRQRPLTLRTLDRALRAVAATSRTQRLPLPPLQLALVGDDRIELVLAEPRTPAPVGFTVEGRSWVLRQDDAAYLTSVPGVDEALRPWPALVTLGRDPQDRQVLADLEGLGLLQVTGPDPGRATAVLAALAVELSFSPWAEEMAVTLLGPDARLPEALGFHGVQSVDDPDRLLTRLERRAADQRQHQPHPVLGQHRLDPDLAEPWATEVVLVGQTLTPTEAKRLRGVVCGEPRVTAAAVVVGDQDAPWSLQLDQVGSGARLQPWGLELVPQSLPAPEADAVLELVAGTGRSTTTPAPWWDGADVRDPDPPPDNVTSLGRKFGGWATETTEEGDMALQTSTAGGPLDVAHPTLLLLGPVELLGPAGSPPPRAEKRCLEYCAWILEHPGRTAQTMASALAIAEGTRRSNMSRLRSWLGESDEGDAYLPDAYSGRIALHPGVSSDWQQLQILLAGGVVRAGTETLRAVLQLVRGAPLADTAPGQWHWAEELRTDMMSCVRDVGVELSRRALADGDLDLARWAASRALAAAPGDELLVAARIRTEHRAGNPAETERLTLQLAAQARRLGVDLDEQTVVLLQEVMEGRVRARMA